jgi:hypothetical protein
MDFLAVVKVMVPIAERGEAGRGLDRFVRFAGSIRLIFIVQGMEDYRDYLGWISTWKKIAVLVMKSGVYDCLLASIISSPAVACPIAAQSPLPHCPRPCFSGPPARRGPWP